VHEGIAAIAAGRSAGEPDLALAEEALEHVGAVVRVAEADLDAVTALSGSGPAYFALLAEAMIEAGLLLGLSRDISTRLVVQTMFGSALLLRDGVRAAFLNAISAAAERSRQLAQQD
jgi:pyrroline-5-carboxylate reductase